MGNQNYRLFRMAISGTDLGILHKKSPWLPMWWSAALPGLGHLCQGVYVKGLLLMSWEILVNLMAHLNLAILYTFTGRFDMAAKVLERDWAIFYGVVFFFSIFDSYRTNVQIGAISRLEKNQRRHNYTFMVMKPGGINFLDRVNPWVAAAWSVLLTGFGHLYNGKKVKAVILLGWAVAIIVLSKINGAVVATISGEFGQAREMVDYQWLMFFPSIYIFAIWDSYNDAVEMNRLFSDAQKSYLRKQYGRGDAGER